MPYSLTPTHFSGLNPSTSSRNTLLWETESPLGTIRNLRMVPRVEPRNNTVRFLWGPASVSTTMAVSWYLERQICTLENACFCTSTIIQLSQHAYRPIVLTTQGLWPSNGTVSSISGWVFTKFSTSSGSVVEELNLDPCTAHPPGLQDETQKKRESGLMKRWIEGPGRGRRREPEELLFFAAAGGRVRIFAE